MTRLYRAPPTPSINLASVSPTPTSPGFRRRAMKVASRGHGRGLTFGFSGGGAAGSAASRWVHRSSQNARDGQDRMPFAQFPPNPFGDQKRQFTGALSMVLVIPPHR